jgi:hypothetical protein
MTEEKRLPERDAKSPAAPWTSGGEMTESGWLSGPFAIELMAAADSYMYDRADRFKPTACQWRSIAARVACFARLGSDLPEGVRQWVLRATAYLDAEQRTADACNLLDEPAVYAAFREAYEHARKELRQRLVAAQDAYRGGDGTYYGYEEYILGEDDDVWNGPTYEAESTAHCNIIRDIFGNPFRPITFSPSWRTDTAVSLARQMYESREFSAMPILADALQDAGCDNEDVLNHCRDANQVHVRGCWVVDLVLRKE